MYIKLEKIEMSVLLLHMKITRKNVKKGFKNNYGSKEGKELIKQYDDITNFLENSIEGLEEGENEQIHLNEQEFNLLHSFLTWYVTEIEITFEAAGKKIAGENKEHLDILQKINDEVNRVKLNYVV